MRRISLFTTLMALLALVAAPAGAQGNAFPDVIPLPDGFQPEGVAVGTGHELYAGSLADGSIYQVDLRTGEGTMLVEADPARTPAVGMDFDPRSGFLFVAGGPTGQAFVYDTDSGDLIQSFALAPPSPAAIPFVNDVIVTRTAAYFTNSFAPEIYAVPLERNGQLAGGFDTIELGEDFDFEFAPFVAFNANGIEATENGQTLFVVNSTFGTLYTVDPETGDAAEIDLGGASVSSGDGIVLDGKTMYVVQNALNQVAVIELSSDLSSGDLVDTLTSDAFDVPTTTDTFGNSLYAVNARFGTTPTPTTGYDLVRIDR